MGSGPVNTTAQTVDEIIRAAIFDVLMKAVRVALVADAPWLNLPVISQILDIFLGRIAQALYLQAAILGTFTVIKFQVQAEKDAYLKAEADLRAAHLSGDPNAISTATGQFKVALSSLIHWDGTASP